MMGDDRRALLEAIRDDPADPLPQHAYADWLEENGEGGRAEYIRLSSLAERTQEQEARRWTLSQAQSFWSAFRLDLDDDTAVRYLARGLLLRLRRTADEFLSLAPDDLESQPVGFVQLTDFAGRVAVLADSPLLRPVRTLSLSTDRLTPDDIERLLSSPHLTRLRDLRFTNCGFGPAHARAVAKAKVLSQLTELHIDLAEATWREPYEIAPYLAQKERGLNNEIGDAGLAALLGAPALGGLRTLSLTGNGFTTAAGGMLARAAYLTRLTHLDVSYNELYAVGLRNLSRGELARRLRTLKIQSNEVSNAGFAAACESPDLGGLEHLNVAGSFNRVSPLLDGSAMTHLAASKAFASLRHLDLGWNEIDSVGVARLTLADLPHLRSLSLRDNRIDDAGFAALARAAPSTRLETLDLRNNAATPSGVSAFTRRRKALAGMRLLLGQVPGVSRRRWETLADTFGDEVYAGPSPAEPRGDFRDW